MSQQKKRMLFSMTRCIEIYINHYKHIESICGYKKKYNDEHGLNQPQSRMRLRILGWERFFC